MHYQQNIGQLLDVMLQQGLQARVGHHNKLC